MCLGLHGTTYDYIGSVVKTVAMEAMVTMVVVVVVMVMVIVMVMVGCMYVV